MLDVTVCQSDILSELLDGWMDGWMDGGTDGWMWLPGCPYLGWREILTNGHNHPSLSVFRPSLSTTDIPANSCNARKCRQCRFDIIIVFKNTLSSQHSAVGGRAGSGTQMPCASPPAFHGDWRCLKVSGGDASCDVWQGAVSSYLGNFRYMEAIREHGEHVNL